MDRREFIKSAALGAAAIGLTSCKAGGNTATEPEGEMKQNFEGVGLLGYGCMRWPTEVDDYGRKTIIQEEVNELVDYAIAHGVNYFDSAPVYHRGASEAATAEALKRHPRESYLIATKCSNFRDYSYEAGAEMYRNSLEIYGTDHIDYYLLHALDGLADFKQRFGDNGLADYFLKERQAGHIRNLGFSFHGSKEGFDELLALNEKYHWDFIQIQMNYSDWRHSRDEAPAEYMYGRLAEAGIPVVVMEPLLGGSLAVIPASEADKLKSREPSATIASWAFRFCGSFPNVLTILSGMTYKEHLVDNLKTFMEFKPVSEEEKVLLEETAEVISRYPLIPCTGCSYCMPCPHGIDIPGVFKFYNGNIKEGSYVVSTEQKDYADARRRYLVSYDKAVLSSAQASHCISCGRCISACPQHIEIPKQLRRIDSYVEKLKRGNL